jgi:hypothetical protein
MATSRVKTSSILQGFPKSRSLLAGNPYFIPSSYESIATVTVGSGGASSVSFASIPSTYAHLQLRIISRDSTGGGTGHNTCQVRMNSDTGSNYNHHVLYGDGGSAGAYAWGNLTAGYAYETAQSGNASNIFSPSVIDILDYTNTNKNTTWRSLTGLELNNTSGNFSFISGVWLNTSAINRIDFILPQPVAQYSQFALYGIKGV